MLERFVYEDNRGNELLPLPHVPRPSAGAPLPFLLSTEDTLLLGYFGWGEPDSDDPIVLLEFHHPFAHYFGAPNDEALEGHPLASRGLQPYSVTEVRESSWIRALAAMNTVHPKHDERTFARLHHYIVTLHDSTFECVARDLQLATAARAHQVAEDLRNAIEFGSGNAGQS
jgi:hypothetical protein